ncbi:MAG: ABC transporter permease [Spirochaetota bacterium]
MTVENETLTEISAKGRVFSLNLRELFAYRELIFMFVKRDFTAVYKQTILGPLWFLLQPLLSTVIFTIVFGNIARISTDGIPHILFYLSGLVCWNYFSSAVGAISNTFTSNINLFSKVYFPRMTIPISVSLTGLITFAIQFVLFAGILAYFGFTQGFFERINLFALLLPVLVFQMIIMALGFGIILASLTTKYRDFSYLIGFGLQLWMYATPVVYPSSLVPEQYRWFIDLNPMSSVINCMRFGFLGVGSPDIAGLLRSCAVSIGILLLGMLLFKRMERSFVDTV